MWNLVAQHQQLRRPFQQHVQQLQVQLRSPACILKRRPPKVVPHTQGQPHLGHEKGDEIKPAPLTREVDERLAEAVAVLEVGPHILQPTQGVYVVGSDGFDNLLVEYLGEIDKESILDTHGRLCLRLYVGCA